MIDLLRFSRMLPVTMLCMLISCAASVSVMAASDQKQTDQQTLDKVLFVGNSFSFYNNGIHNHLGSLIRANGDWQRGQNRLRLQTLSGGHIHEQLQGLQATLTNDSRGWQAVVLQAHSNEPVLESKKARFDSALTEAINIIKSHALVPILFMTWGYKGDEPMAEAIANAYITQANKHQIKLVPVGLAFTQAAKSLPNIELFVQDVLSVKGGPSGKSITYQKDLKHPSQAGTYLAACVFYASLYQQSPEGNLFTAGLDNQTAKALQVLSWQVVNRFQQKDLVKGSADEQ